MDYKIPQPEDGASEVREPAVAYCPGVRRAAVSRAVSGAYRIGKETARDAERERERKQEWESLCDYDHGRKLAAEWGVTTEEEFIAAVNAEIHKYREEMANENSN
jgi:hypothetical protein